jgi:pyruvate kinase
MKTKVVCTIGPATESPEMLEKLIENGMSVARLNFSHDTHENHGKRIKAVREISKRLGKEVQILCDLQGPKIRIRNFDNAPRVLANGEEVVLTTSSCKAIQAGEIVIEDPYLHTDVKSKDIILIDDGLLELIVDSVSNHKIHCTVVNGGDLYPRKGVNLPLTETTTSSLTEKDVNDLNFILTQDPDWIAISFVQNAGDVLRLRKLMGDSKARVMCKIELANAVKNLSQIINEADGIMVARGDLGVEIPIETLPIIQKRIIKKCNFAEKPVVTATQMLASMTESPVPTRAEVTDIANAVLDGTDAVMMSNETAVGKYPINALKIMVKVVNETEKYLYDKKNIL